MISRRRLIAGAALGALLGRRAFAQGLFDRSFGPGGPAPSGQGGGGFVEGGTSGRVVFAQLRYRGGEWDPRPRAALPIMAEVARRTSVETSDQRRELPPADPHLFSYPFLYMAGRRRFDPFTANEIEILRRFTSFGGLLLIDDATGVADSEFAQAVKEQFGRILPGKPFARLPHDHTIFRTFYLIRTVGGRTAASPYLEGITLDEWTPVVFCANDLGGAWERDYLGNPTYRCTPGGEAQRHEAFKLGVNITLYAVTANYKRDQIHIPFIRERTS